MKPYILFLTVSFLTIALLQGQATRDMIVSASDAKFVRKNGAGTYPEGVPVSLLSLIDASTFPPTILKEVPVEHSVYGPPQCIAITPDGKLAFVGAPDTYDYDTKTLTPHDYVQVVSLEAESPRVIDKIAVDAHPQGLAITPDGRLLLAATTSGKVAVIEIGENVVELIDQVTVSKKRLSGIAITPDGKSAIVANRDEQGLTVLSIEGTQVTNTEERISTGVGPYDMSVSADGRWCVVANGGLGAIADGFGTVTPDVDAATLVDISDRPFRAVQHFTVPPVPEGITISPDGRWIVVNSMNGSNLPEAHPDYQEKGTLTLFEIQEGKAVEVDQIPGGKASQGVVFTKDNRYVLLQMNVEKAIGVFEVKEGSITDTGHRIELSGGPTSIRSMPR